MGAPEQIKNYKIANAGMGVWFIQDPHGIIWRVQATTLEQLPGMIVFESIVPGDKRIMP